MQWDYSGRLAITIPANYPPHQARQALGEVETEEMRRVFNMGVGLVLVVSGYYANHIRSIFHDHGYDCWAIGEIVER